MHDLSKTISEYIEQQFPAVYREDGPNLVAFTKAYYEFMENTSTSPTTLSRSMFQNRDIDETLDSFLVHFKEKYLSEFPYAKAVDKRFVIKHIMDIVSIRFPYTLKSHSQQGLPDLLKIKSRVLGLVLLLSLKDS